MKIFLIRLLLQLATFATVFSFTFIIFTIFNSNNVLLFSSAAPLVVYVLFVVEGVWAGFYPQIIAITPNGISKVMGNSQQFNKGILSSALLIVVGPMLAAVEGDEWKRHRQILNSSFKTEILRSIANNIVSKHSQHFIDKIKETIEMKDPVSIDMHDLINRLTMDIICDSAFGYNVNALSYSPESNRAFISLKYIIEGFAFITLPFITKTSFYQNYLAHKSLVFKIVDSIISQDEAKRKTSLVLDLLINKEFSQEEIQSETFGFLVAGFETTATLLSWTLLNLSSHPELQRKVIEEVDTILQGRKAEWEDMERLKYTVAVIYETLRHDSPVMAVTRESLVDTEIEQTFIYKGTTVWVSPMVVLMNPKVWPNPKEFNPERFMGDQSKLTNAIFPAFGVGPRACIGKQFALHEAVAILAAFLQNFTVGPSPPLIQSKISILRGLKEKKFLLSIIPRKL